MGQGRFHKLDFPKFDGSGDPLPFITKCEHYVKGSTTWKKKRCGLRHSIFTTPPMIGTPRSCSMRARHPRTASRISPTAILGHPSVQSTRGAGCMPLHDDSGGLPRPLQDAGPLQESQRVQLFLVGLQEPLSLDIEI